MKRIFAFFVIIALLLLSMESCKRQDRKLLRFSQSDAVLCDFTWEDEILQHVQLNNPFVNDNPEYEDYASIFNYSIAYEYENGQIHLLTGNKYRTEFTYDGNNLACIDQFSYDGVLAHRVTFSYEDSNKSKAIYYSISDEAIKWLESRLYPRKDSTGERIYLEMPSDTTLHVCAEAEYQWENDNLVYAKTSFAQGFSLESHMEYDDKVNPFYHTYYDFNKLEIVAVMMSFGFNNMGVSKNNITRVSVINQSEDQQTQETILDYTYEYDGNYPIVQKNVQNQFEYYYEYVK